MVFILCIYMYSFDNVLYVIVIFILKKERKTERQIETEGKQYQIYFILTVFTKRYTGQVLYRREQDIFHMNENGCDLC